MLLDSRHLTSTPDAGREALLPNTGHCRRQARLRSCRKEGKKHFDAGLRMGRCAEVLVVVTAVAVLHTHLTASYCPSEVFKSFSGYYISGATIQEYQSISVMQCASLCIYHSACRAFNVDIRRGKPHYNCQLKSSYEHLQIVSYYVLYYKRNLYETLNYEKQLGRLVYTAPAQKMSWNDAQYSCKALWGELLVPRSPAEWQWIEQTYHDMKYPALWLPIKEDIEADDKYGNQQKFTWQGWYINSTEVAVQSEVPFPVDVDDRYSRWIWTLYGLSDMDTIDCLRLQPSTSTTGLEAVIEQCYYYSSVSAGFICEAAIPDPATYIHLFPLVNAGTV